MKRQFKVIGTLIENNQEYSSEWCNLDYEEITVGGETKRVSVSLEFIEKFACVCCKMLNNWQFIYREVEN